MLVSATSHCHDLISSHRSKFAESCPSSHADGVASKIHPNIMTLSTSQADPVRLADGRPSAGSSTSSPADSSYPSTSSMHDGLAQPLPTRPKNHVRGIASDSRLWTTGRGFFESRSRERQPYATAQEQKELEAERDAIVQIQNAQAAKRRARVMRLTPAFPSVPREDIHTPSPPSSEASSARTASEADLATPPDSRLPFPSPKSRISLAPLPNPAPLHPGSRKALALKANSPGPEVLGGLSLDLHCLPSPAGDRSSISSTASSHSDLIRKKSGEPVKSSLKQYSSSYVVPRSASEAILPTSSYGTKSVPNTPGAPKFVHFDTQLEHVKIFKVKGRPQAVSREGSPEQTETETEEERDYPWFGSRRGGGLSRSSGVRSPTAAAAAATSPATEGEEQLVLRLPNFPSSAKLSLDRDIFLERIYLSDDLRSVRGTVQVKNLSFEKWVAVRFTLDHWATVNEVSAEYSESIKEGSADRFVFSIKLNEVLNWPRGAGLNETKTIFLCLRYTTNGREIWDNNDGANYQLDFRKRPALPAEVARMPPVSNDSRGSASFGNTAPRRYTLSAIGPASTSSIIEMGRRTGVYGQKATRDNAMERLKQELERLRSDEEDSETAPTSGSFITEMSKRRSPPVSPGGAKPSSPSLWGSRYDFGASLRDPSSGSRKTDAGRAAALDYFSARPSTTTVAASSPVRSSFVISAATPSPDGATPRSAAELVPKFGRLGMLSPGLGEVVVEHAAVTGSNTSSPTGSLLQVPRLGVHPLSPGGTSSSTSTSTRFNSFPPNRNAQPRSVYGIWDDEARSGSGRNSASGSASGSRSGTPSPVGFSSTRLDVKADGAVLQDYTPDGSQASPNSLNNSPHPFSPTLSTTSVDSDSTAMVDQNGKSTMTSSLDDLRNISGPSAYHFLRADHLEGRTRPSSFAAGDEPEQHGYSSSALSSSTTLSPSSELATPDEEFMRPSNLTSFNELVARFCWNNDNQVPQTSPAATSLSAHTPSSASGRSTPIARAGGAY